MTNEINTFYIFSPSSLALYGCSYPSSYYHINLSNKPVILGADTGETCGSSSNCGGYIVAHECSGGLCQCVSPQFNQAPNGSCIRGKDY